MAKAQTSSWKGTLVMRMLLAFDLPQKVTPYSRTLPIPLSRTRTFSAQLMTGRLPFARRPAPNPE